MPVAPLQRSFLRSQAAARLRTHICRGRLEPGSRITEVGAAEQLGISRTPMREALLQLEREGLVESMPGQGFRVAPLHEDEVREVYPILGTLEALAVRSIEALSAKRVARLRIINEAMRAPSASAARLIELDAQWHDTLLAAAANTRAVRLCAQLRRQVQRYEFAYMQVEGSPSLSPTQHDAILSVLLDGDVEDAARRIQAQWVDSIEPLRARIRSAERSQASAEEVEA